MSQQSPTLLSPPPFPNILLPPDAPQEVQLLMSLGASRDSWWKGIKHPDVAAKPGPPRPKQVWPEGNWKTWLLLGGRGFGKTRPAAEATIDYAVEHPGCRIGVIAKTAADVRDTCFEGDSGLLACLPTTYREFYNRSLSELTINGSHIKGFSAEEPSRLRGPNHHYVWCDELASWSKLQEAWDMMLLTLRLGDDPKVVVGTTPRPLPLIRELLKSPTT